MPWQILSVAMSKPELKSVDEAARMAKMTRSAFGRVAVLDYLHPAPNPVSEPEHSERQTGDGGGRQIPGRVVRRLRAALSAGKGDPFYDLAYAMFEAPDVFLSSRWSPS